MARLLPFPHEVHHERVLRHVEIEVDLHAAVVGMAGHRVPHRAGLQLRHAHHQLAGLHLPRQNVLANRAVIRRFQAAQFLPHAVLRADVHRRVCRVRRAGIEVELRRIRRVLGCKHNVLAAAPDVQSVAVAQGVHRAIHRHRAFAADVDDAQLAPLQKILRAQLLARRQRQRTLHRHGTARDDAVNVAVHQLDIIRAEQVVNQKFLAEPLRVVRLYVARRGCRPKFHEEVLLRCVSAYKSG